MPTLIISDLHLETSRPEIVRLFADLLEREQDITRLLILGDLFESWVGDDDDRDLGREVALRLRHVSARGVRCSFIHGNRDFLLGGDYAAEAGFEILADGTVLDLEGVPTLLMHGDVLCTRGIACQKFRSEVRDVYWQRAFLAKPLPERLAYAAHARTESAKHTDAAAAVIMDVSQHAVVDAMRAAGVTRLIHGHTHRQAVHSFDLDGMRAERIVLGDWYRNGSVLRIAGEHVDLRRFEA